MTSSDQRALYRVTGTVQGVGFRHFVKQEADRLGIRGTVRNEPDGSVVVLAEGSASALRTLEAALTQGPEGSSVTDTHKSEADGNFPSTTNFEIKR